jgi:hypothetical protein
MHERGSIMNNKDEDKCHQVVHEICSMFAEGELPLTLKIVITKYSKHDIHANGIVASCSFRTPIITSSDAKY